MKGSIPERSECLGTFEVRSRVRFQNERITVLILTSYMNKKDTIKIQKDKLFLFISLFSSKSSKPIGCRKNNENEILLKKCFKFQLFKFFWKKRLDFHKILLFLFRNRKLIDFLKSIYYILKVYFKCNRLV